MFNDVAVAIRVRPARAARVSRAAVVDLDVHHGNGTAFIFDGDPRVFTFSMHQQHNYPSEAARLARHRPARRHRRRRVSRAARRRARPGVRAPARSCFYLAGADPFEDDQLGGLSLTKAGLRQRDRAGARRRPAPATCPVVVLLAGGYARRLDDTVDIHCATIEEAGAAPDSMPPSGSSARPTDGLQVDDLARAIIRRTSSSVNVRGSMTSSSSCWAVESGAGGARSGQRKKIISSSQNPGVGSRRPSQLEAPRHQADFLFALPRRPGQFGFAGLQPAGRQLPQILIDGVAVLADEDRADRAPASAAAPPIRDAARCPSSRCGPVGSVTRSTESEKMRPR